MKWMPIRQFLRGGYQKLEGPTVITSHGHPLFTVMPAQKLEPDRDLVVEGLDGKKMTLRALPHDPEA